MNLSTLPIPVKRAIRWCAETHRRLPTIQGAMWSVAVLRGDVIMGVAIVGRPNARLLDSTELPQPALQVLRVACLPEDVGPRGHKGANSMLYGAVARAARAMGCVDLSTYTHHDEPGTSLRAAGWIEDVWHDSHGGSYDRPSRKRSDPVEGGAKVRWWAPWSRHVADKVKSRAVEADAAWLATLISDEDSGLDIADWRAVVAMFPSFPDIDARYHWGAESTVVGRGKRNEVRTWNGSAIYGMIDRDEWWGGVERGRGVRVENELARQARMASEDR